MALVAASLTARTRSSATSLWDGAGSWCTLGPNGTPKAGRQLGEAATTTSSYCPLPALRPSWPGGGSCRPGEYSSVTVRKWGRRGTSPAPPRAGARQPSTSSPALSRTVRRLPAPLTRRRGDRPAGAAAARCVNCSEGRSAGYFPRSVAILKRSGRGRPTRRPRAPRRPRRRSSVAALPCPGRPVRSR
jgi:hypothetical protein